jgi:hypothetical protein
LRELEGDAEALPSFGGFGVERGGLNEVACLFGKALAVFRADSWRGVIGSTPSSTRSASVG